MAGMPQRRARLERERQLAKPTVLPPAEFRALSAGQKMEVLLGCSLDDAYIISHWDTNTADVHQLSAKVRLIEIMTKHGFRFAVEAMRDQSKDRAVDQLAKAITDRLASKSNDAAWEHCPLGSCRHHLACMNSPCRSTSRPSDPADQQPLLMQPVPPPVGAVTPADAHSPAPQPRHNRDTKDLSS